MNKPIVAAVLSGAFLVTVLDGFLESNGALRRAYKNYSPGSLQLKTTHMSALMCAGRRRVE